jgi:hypothetical protein
MCDELPHSFLRRKVSFHKLSHLHKLLPGVSPLPSLPDGFWRLDRGDAGSMCAMMATTLAIWAIMFTLRGRFSIACYWDGPNYLYAALTLYHIPPENPWTIYFRYPPSYFACHMPGYPLLIRLLAELTIHRFVIAAHLSILLTSILLCYAFRRLLIAYDAVRSPVWSAVLLSIIPLRFVIYHNVCASEPLFLCYCYFAFIFLRVNRLLPLFLCICGACVTRVEGLVLWGTVGLVYLLRVDIIRAAVIAGALIAPAAVLRFHAKRFGDWLAYLHFNQGHNGLLRWPPFHDIVKHGRRSDDVKFHYSTLYLFVPFAIGTILVFGAAVPLGIFAAVYVVFSASLFHIDLYRYALPGYVFAVLVGFDELWASAAFKKAAIWLVPIYMALVGKYSIGQLRSNIAPDWFLKSVLSAPIAYS